MATYLKIRGLNRGRSAIADGSTNAGAYRGFRVASALGLTYAAGVKASLSTALTGANNDLDFTAKSGGTWGNAVKVKFTDPSANDQTLSVAVTWALNVPTIDVSLATNGGGTITSTAALVKAAVLADEEAMALLSNVANKTGNDGTGVVTAMSATALSSGTNSGVGEPFYMRVDDKKVVVVDIDDKKTVRSLQRNPKGFVTLGLA